MICRARLAAASATLFLGAIAVAETIHLDESPWYRSELRASSFAISSQAEVCLAPGPGGAFDVIWSSRRQQDGAYGIYAQRLDRRGVAVGREIEVNRSRAGHQVAPSIARGIASTWAAWQSHGQDGHAGGIVLRRLDGAASEEIIVNDAEREGHQSSPVIEVAPDGGVLVAWTHQAPGETTTSIRARLFDADGRPCGAGFGLCEETESSAQPSVAFGADGAFVIAYAISDEAQRPLGARVQHFSAGGAPRGSALDVPARFGQAIEPVVTATAGGFAIAWHEPQARGDGYVVRAATLDRMERSATVSGSGASGAAIAGMSGGGHAVAWNADDGDGSGIFVRLYDRENAPVGPGARVNAQVEGDQAMRIATGTRRLVCTAGGDLIVAWSGDAGTADSSSANATMLTRAPIDPTLTQGATGEMIASARISRGDSGAAPHVPPVFDPRALDDGEREVTLGPDGVGFTGILSTGWTPPDPHMAVGPSHLVLMSNGAIVFMTKTGSVTFSDEIENSFGFWGNLGATGFVFDPEVLYDPTSERFFAMAAEAYAPPNQTRSYVLIAVSDDSNPNGTWHKYRFDTTSTSGNLFDSPNIGVSDNVVYVTGDGFGVGAVYPLYTFDKASLLAGNPPAISRQALLSTSTQSAGLPAVTAGSDRVYLIEHRESSSNSLVRIITINDPLGSPSFTAMNLSVPSYQSPEDPPQAGTTQRPETFDARFWSAKYRNGSLWATHHAGSNRVLARWYEVATNGWPDSGQSPALVQSGVIDPGPGIRTFFPSIAVDECGNAAICYARSSSSEFISMATSYRYATDAPGTFGPSTIRKVSTGPYTINRWGDYSAIESDPAEPTTFWAHHEYAIGSTWRTWVASIEPGFPPGDLNCDGAVNFGDLLALLASWGPCAGCPADLDGNGVVDFTDLLSLLSAWTG